jgi:hypothetical protein
MEEMSHRKKMTRKHKKLYKSTSGHYYKMKNKKKAEGCRKQDFVEKERSHVRICNLSLSDIEINS